MRTIRNFVLVLISLMLINTSASWGQRIWYVNSQFGQDIFDGMSASTPKKTINRAIQDAKSGDAIVVAATIVSYGPTTNGEPTTIRIVDKKIFLRSDAGTPKILSVIELDNELQVPDNVLTFDQGPFNLAGGLTLRKGNIVGTRRLILGGTVLIIARLPGEINPTLDTAPGGYSPIVDFVYDGAGGGMAQISTGQELTGPGIDYALNNLIMGPSQPVRLTLSTPLRMKGTLVSEATPSTINLGGNALVLVGAGVTHALGGDVFNGTLVFSLDEGDASVRGGFALPKITALSSAAPHVLTLMDATTVTSLEATGQASIQAPKVASIGQSGSTAQSVLCTGAGSIVLGSVSTVHGNVTLNSRGIATSSADQARILFSGSAPITINGDVTNSAEIVVRDADDSPNDGIVSSQKGNGVIAFPDQSITINGSIRSNVTVSGTLADRTSASNHGQIRFLRADQSVSDLVVTGPVSISSGSTLSATAGKVTGMGNILVGTPSSAGATGGSGISGLTIIDGGVSNSSVWIGFKALSTMRNNGQFDLTARGSGAVGTFTRKIGAIVNVSRSVDGSGNGDILLGGSLSTGGFNGTEISVQGSAGGGIIQLGNENVIATAVRNSRNSTAPHLVFGVAEGRPGKTVQLTSLTTSGLSSTEFRIPIDTVFAVSGTTSVSGGEVRFVNLRNGSSLSFADVVMVGGRLDLSGGQGTSGRIITANLALTDGIVNLGTGSKMWLINGSTVTFGSFSTRPVFENGSNTLLLFTNSSPTSSQTIRIDATDLSFPGSVTVDNTTGFVNAVQITGGTLQIGGKLKFAKSGPPYEILLDGARINVQSTSGSLDFENSAGYLTENGGLVSMSGIGSSEIGGNGSFGNLEANNSVATKIASNIGAMRGSFFLTRGIVHDTDSDPSGESLNVRFDNSATPPTLIVGSGSFASGIGPVFISRVDVMYVAGDRRSSTEIPSDSTKLRDLTIATSNGAVAGKGIVTLTGNVTINGALRIRENQTLAIETGGRLFLRGDSAVVNGYLINKSAPNFAELKNIVVLSRPTGTHIVGSGVLCDVLVGAGSTGNSMNGTRALVSRFLGVDGVWGGGDDFDTLSPAAATGELRLSGGPAGITLHLGPGYKEGTTLGNITTTDAGNQLSLAGDLTLSGNISHNGGRIDLGVSSLRTLGTEHSLTGGSEIIGTGVLRFEVLSGARMTVKGGRDTLSVDVEVTSSAPLGPLSTLTLVSSGQDLCLAKNLRLSGSTTILDIGDGRTLSLLGPSLTTTSGTSIRASTEGTSGTLQLKPISGSLVFNLADNITVPNLRLSGDVTLIASQRTLTIDRNLVHEGGILRLGDQTISIKGVYRRSGTASYSAASGYLEFSGLVFDQGQTNVTVPNLRLSSGSLAMAGTGVVTVDQNLDLQFLGTFTHGTGGAARLAVANGVVVNYRSGSLDIPPAYLGSVMLVLDDPPDNATIDATVWPGVPLSLVSTLRVGTSSESTFRTFKIPGARTVNKSLELLWGTLDLNGAALTIGDGATIRRRQTSSLSATTVGSTFSAASNVSVIYEPSASTRDGGDFKTGIELPNTVRNLAFTRSRNVANCVATIQSAVTVQASLDIRNDVTASPTSSGIFTLLGDIGVAMDSSFSAATVPVINWTTPIAVTGTSDQRFRVPASGIAISSIIVNKPNGSIALLGGDVKCNGVFTFNRGLIVTEEKNALVLTRGVGTAAQGFIRNVAPPAKSHVVGNVRQNLVSSNSISFAHHEFPVGDSLNYRPATLTFHNAGLTGSVDLGVVASVRHVNERPSGSVGLPIVKGIDENTPLGRYPAFYWFISSSSSLGGTIFNLGLTAAGYDPNEINLSDVLQRRVKIIRRDGAPTDVQNQWVLQGTDYDNFAIGDVPTVVNTNSLGGLQPAGAIFTYGLKPNLFIASLIPNQILPDGARSKKIKLTNPQVVAGNTQALTWTASSSDVIFVEATILDPDTLFLRGKIATPTGSPVTVTVAASNPVDGRIITTFTVSVSGVTPVEPTDLLPTEFNLAQNYPNPFNPSTTIRFSLPKESPVTLEIYNMLGVKVRTLLAGETMNAAFHSIVWDGKDEAGVTVPTGVYLYRIHADKFVSSKKMTLLK